MTSVEIAAEGIEPVNAEDCFSMGMAFSSGAGVPVDLVQAHKWFNIAAMRGHKDAAQLRREIAEQMSDSEIGCAQRAARDWLKPIRRQRLRLPPSASRPDRYLIGHVHARNASRTIAITFGQSPGVG